MPQNPDATKSGQIMIEAMNMMDYDAMAIGPQDVALGSTSLRERMAQATFPLLSANLTVVETGALFAEPYALVELAGHTAAVIGLTGADGFPQNPPTGTESLTLTDPMDAARAYVAEVTSQADIIILLSNAGLPVNQQIAQELPDIDVIVSGGTGTLTAPIRYDEAHAVVAEAGYRGEWLGRMTLQISAAGQVTTFTGEALTLTEDYADNAAMRKYVDSAKGGS